MPKDRARRATNAREPPLTLAGPSHIEPMDKKWRPEMTEAERLERAKAEASKARAQGKNVTYEEAEQGSGPLSCAC